jgi:hypothetical protein
MIDQLLPIFLIILVIGLIWILLKFVLKLTIKVFSCGCLVILVIGMVLFVLGFIELPAFLK